MTPQAMLINIIDETNLIIKMIESLSSPIAEKGELEKIEQSMTQRDKLIHQFFKQCNNDELNYFSNQLIILKSCDEQMISLAIASKEQMAKQIIKQKKNSKATNAYQNT